MNASNRREFLSVAGRYAALSMGAPLLSLFISGCETMKSVGKLGASVGVASGLIDESQAESITKSLGAVSRSFEDITPEQEYYIGRTVGARILSKYGPFRDTKANRYVNMLGQTLAQASDLPETFGGYHFLIQDSDEINAMAAPGGLIFVTRGMIRCCEHEDALAGVLAHEVGHVQLRHGLQAIKKSRITSALITIGLEGAKSFGGEELASLTQTFESAISDITQTLIRNGYSRSFERDADEAAVTLLKRVGYNPNGLVDMLRVMETKLTPGTLDFASTHPSPASRIDDIQKQIGKYGRVMTPDVRQARFAASLGNV